MGELVVGRIEFSPALTTALETLAAQDEGRPVFVHEEAPLDTGLRVEAEAQLALVLAAIQPAPRDLALKWLASLGVLTAGKMAAEDARLKASAYLGLLDYPPCCYTEETLRDAATLFTWFPSYSELAGFLDARAREPRDMAYRLRRIAEGPPKRRNVARSRSWEKLGDLRK